MADWPLKLISSLVGHRGKVELGSSSGDETWKRRSSTSVRTHPAHILCRDDRNGRPEAREPPHVLVGDQVTYAKALQIGGSDMVAHAGLDEDKTDYCKSAQRPPWTPRTVDK